MAKPVGKIFAELDLDKKKYTDGLINAKKKGTKTLSEIEKAWKGLGKKSEATYDQMRAKVNANYDKIKHHSKSTADDIYRAEKAKNEKIARINKQQFGQQKSLLDRAKKHWMAFSAIAIAGIYAMQRAFRKILSLYADFEVALKRLGNVSDETIPEMRKKILSISPALGSVTELTKGYYQVMSAGVTEPLRAMDMLRVSAKMSKEATIEQAEAVKGLAALMGAYTTELKSATDAADLLYSIEKLGITTVQELTPLIGNLANMARAVGLNADEMAAALAQVSTTGAGTSISVTQLQGLLTALSKKFTLLPPEIRKYGSAIEAVKALGFQGVLKEIMRYTEGNSTALVKMLGRQEGYLALLQLSKNEFGGYSERLEEMTKKTGAFDDAWKRYSTTLTAIWNTFKNTIGKQAILIGEKLAPGIKKVVEQTSAWFQANEKIITQNMTTVINAITVAVGALATVYETLAKARKAVAEQTNKISKEEQESAKSSIKLMLDQQTGWAGAKAVFKLFAEAYTYWLDKFTKKEEEWTVTIGRRKKVVTATMNETSTAMLRQEMELSKIRLAYEKLKRSVANINDEMDFLEHTIELQWKAWHKLKEEQRLLSYVIPKVTDKMDLLATATQSAWDIWDDQKIIDAMDHMETAIQDMWNTWEKGAGDAESSLAGIVDSAKNMARSVKNTLGTVWSVVSDIWGKIKSMAGMFTGAITFFITFPGDLKEAMERFTDSIADFPKIVDEFLAAVGTFVDNLPKIVITFIKSAGKFIDGLVKAIPKVITALIKELPKLVDTIIKGAEKFTAAILKKLPDIVAALIKQVPKLITSIMEKFIPALMDAIPKVIEKLLQGIPAIIKAFIAGIPKVITALMKAIASLITILAKEIPKIAKGLTDALIKDGPKIIQALLNGLPAIFQAIHKAIPAFMTAMVKDTPRIIQALIDDMPRVVDALIEGIKQNINEVGEGISDLFGGGGGGGIDLGDILDPFDLFHKGGIIGQTQAASGSVVPAVFAGAPQAHRGLMAGEVPIIAKRGEGIFTPAQMRALGREGGSDRPIHIQLNLDGREVGLAIVKDGDVIEQMDYQLTKRNRRVYA